jgi:hypothetical protein
MGLRVNDDGASECHLVMRWIGVEPPGKITPRESEQTSIRCLVTRESEKPTSGSKADDGSGNTAGAASRFIANRQQMSIVKVMHQRYRVLQRAFEMLERHAWKSRTCRSEGRG